MADRYTYDEVGRVLSVTDPARQLIEADPTTGPTTTWTYDTLGRRSAQDRPERS